MVGHAKAVSGAAKRALVVGDLPYLTYHTTPEEAVRNAARFVVEGVVAQGISDERQRSRREFLHRLNTFERAHRSGDPRLAALAQCESDAYEMILGDAGLKALVEGVELTGRAMLSALERHGVKKLDPQGEKFDPNFHQAMFEIPNPNVANNTVVQVVQAGYAIGDRVLRPAMVGVAKGGPKTDAASEDAAKA
mgnify:CR=1 FL=1